MYWLSFLNSITYVSNNCRLLKIKELQESNISLTISSDLFYGVFFTRLVQENSFTFLFLASLWTITVSGSPAGVQFYIARIANTVRENALHRYKTLGLNHFFGDAIKQQNLGIRERKEDNYTVCYKCSIVTWILFLFTQIQYWRPHQLHTRPVLLLLWWGAPSSSGQDLQQTHWLNKWDLDPVTAHRWDGNHTS